jgi:3-deoxy-manno-octulosonate cytidylyltransferase (CMP-KDO synthetase)
MSGGPLALIPARLQSQRLPGKALADVGGLPMVVRCARNAAAAGLRAWVCTDSPAILDACQAWGVQHLATPAFATGTDRCTWAARTLDAERLVILQGDEPLIEPTALTEFAAALLDAATGPDTILNGLSLLDAAGAQDPNNVKALQRPEGSISQLTRSYMPASGHLKQLGLYGGRLDSFERFAAIGPSPQEHAESIEMLRWLNAGQLLQGVLLATPALSVDTSADLEAARQWLAQTDPEQPASQA